jgi:hypothetical protein
VSVGKKHLPRVTETEVYAPFECECGEPLKTHVPVISKITEDPFGPTKTESVLLCPGARFRAKQKDVARLVSDA